LRRLSDVTGSPAEIRLEPDAAIHAVAQSQQERKDEVEAELQALKKQLGA